MPNRNPHANKIMVEYEQRFLERDISAYNPAFLQGLLGPDDPKFYSYRQGDAEPVRFGEAKLFYGFTCIAWAERDSMLFQSLVDLQNTLRDALQAAGLHKNFTFLDPPSFHMTVCDINTSTTPIQHRKTIIRRSKEAFTQIGALGEITAQVRGIGLKRTIAALVRFNCYPELQKVLDIERRIKAVVGVNVREFAGHISLAYFVRHPGEQMEAIKDILLPYINVDVGEFMFSEVDLTYFSDMNTYNPVLTFNLETGSVTERLS